MKKQGKYHIWDTIHDCQGRQGVTTLAFFDGSGKTTPQLSDFLPLSPSGQQWLSAPPCIPRQRKYVDQSNDHTDKYPKTQAMRLSMKV